MYIENEIKLDFDDVLLVPQRSTLKSRSEVKLEREFQFYHSNRIWEGIPIICSNMSFCSFDLAKELAKYKMIALLHKYHSVYDLVQYFNENPNNIDYTFISIGYNKSDISNVLKFRDQTNIQPNLRIDVPNGHIDIFIEYCSKVRKEFPDSIIFAGNITDPASTQELIVHGGADVIFVGIGGGSACTTRFITGCGVPQLSCCIENAHKAHGLQSGPKKLGLICSDGGHRFVGDVCKAICAGSDFVCLGGYFAGCDVCEGEWLYDENKIKKMFTYYGMSTHYNQDFYENEIKNYRASEGTKITTPYKGTIQELVQELLGGMRSCCSYLGSESIRNMSKCAKFCKVNKIHNNQKPIFGV